MRRARRSTCGVADAGPRRAASAKSRRREQQRVGEEVVEPPAVRRRRRRPRSTPRSRAASERELEVGGVLRRRVALDQPRRARSAASTAAGVGGVEVADDEVDRDAERVRVVEARSRRRSRRVVPVGQVRRARRGGGRIAAGEHDATRTGPIGPSAGITRFRFEGSATRDGRPLSPAVPSSPGIRLSCVHDGRSPLSWVLVGRLRRMAGEPEIVLVRHGETEWSALGQAHVVHRHPAHAARARAGGRAARRGSRRTSSRSCSRARAERARDTCALAGLGDHALGRRRPRRVGLRRLRGSHDRRDPPGSAGLDDLHRTARRAARPPRRSLRAPTACLRVPPGADGPVALFSHGHFLRVLGARWIGLGAGDGRLLGLDTATISVLGHERDQRVLRVWNSCASSMRCTDSVG